MNYIKELTKSNAKIYLDEYISDRPKRLDKFQKFLLDNKLITKEVFEGFSIDSFIEIFIACKPSVKLILDSSKLPNYDDFNEKPIWFYIERWRLGDNNDGWSLNTIPIIDGLWVYLEEIILKNIKGTFIDTNPIQDPNVMDYLKPTIQPHNFFGMGLYVLNPIIIMLYASCTKDDYNFKIELNNYWNNWNKSLGTQK